MEIIAINQSGSKKVIFTDISVEYKGKTILYRDIDWIRYGAVDFHVNGIPFGTFDFTIHSPSKKITIGLVAPFNINKERKKEIYRRLVEQCMQKIEPVVGEKYVNLISTMTSKPYEIAGMLLSPSGFAKKKWFGKTKLQPWVQYRGSRYQSGKIVFLSMDAGFEKPFATLMMSNKKNAVLLPVLMEKCSRKFR